MVDPERKKSFISMFEHVSKNRADKHEQNGHAYHAFEPEHEEEYAERALESHELSDEIDHQILMHRDAHFGGDFEVMLKYYSDDDHIGINPDFDSERISYLAQVEKETGQDLAPLFLTGAEAESVARARRAYSQLKEIYELSEEDEGSSARLIADLILSEFEEPVEEIEAVVAQGIDIVPDLLALVNSDEFYNPLYPGYGYAPYLAIHCLGTIGDARAIIPIFETFSKPIIFDEMVIVDALVNIGARAQEFLLKVLKGRPLTQDNPNAAFALISFAEDPQVAIASFEELQHPEVREKPLLTTYLLCSCQFLNTAYYRDAFKKMAEDTSLPPSIRDEMKEIIKEWELSFED